MAVHNRIAFRARFSLVEVVDFSTFRALESVSSLLLSTVLSFSTYTRGSAGPELQKHRIEYHSCHSSSNSGSLQVSR